MKKLLILLFVVFAGAVSAAIPSIEGLFRGAGNNDITAEGVQFSYIASRELEPNEEMPDGKIEKIYVRLTTSKEKNRDINLVQEVFRYENNVNNSLFVITHLLHCLNYVLLCENRLSMFSTPLLLHNELQ